MASGAFELARGNREPARAIYLDNIRPSAAQAVPMLVLADSASFLWRWQFYGAAPSLEQEWAEVTAHAQRHFSRASLAFADVHAALAEAATGDDEGVRAALRLAEPRPGRPPAAGRSRASRCAPEQQRSAAATMRRQHGYWRQHSTIAADRRQSRAARGLRGFAGRRPASLRQSARAARLLRARINRRPSARDEAWLALCERSAGEV